MYGKDDDCFIMRHFMFSFGEEGCFEVIAELWELLPEKKIDNVGYFSHIWVMGAARAGMIKLRHLISQQDKPSPWANIAKPKYNAELLRLPASPLDQIEGQ